MHPKSDKKLNSELANAYKILHSNGNNNGLTSVPAIKVGFELAYSIIKRIEP